MLERPQRGEIGDYYFRYIDLVPPDADVLDLIGKQRDSFPALLRGVSEDGSRKRYEPGKWSMRQVVGHLTDTELLFLSRAFWFARGFDSALPSFDQDAAAQTQRADDVSWAGLIEGFRGVRAATAGFFETLPGDAWSRAGTASNNPFTVRSLAYVIAGHVLHHEKVLREKYL